MYEYQTFSVRLSLSWISTCVQNKANGTTNHENSQKGKLNGRSSSAVADALTFSFYITDLLAQIFHEAVFILTQGQNQKTIEGE